MSGHQRALFLAELLTQNSYYLFQLFLKLIIVVFLRDITVDITDEVPDLCLVNITLI